MSIDNAISEHEALQAVRNRDARYDGRLYFAVLTTGIFCKPSCTSRQANVENIRFYQSSDKAKQAGFRACKRCAPEALPENRNKLIQVARYIEAHAGEKLTLSMLAAQFELSPTHLQKAFKTHIGLSPKAFQDGIRQQRFKSLLKEGESVTDAIFAAGYGSSSGVFDKAADTLGMTPGAYKAGAVGEKISYTIGNTQFGLLMLAATDIGVCFAMFGEQESELLDKLADEFPRAQTMRASHHVQLDRWFSDLDAYLAAKQLLPDIPLDLRGTAFQMRVWAYLQTIEAGVVVSYRDVADGIGQPTAIRAAATACAKNRVALLVPCHRVLRGDGGIGGYRWGVETKQALLSVEQRAADSKISSQ